MELHHLDGRGPRSRWSMSLNIVTSPIVVGPYAVRSRRQAVDLDTPSAHLDTEDNGTPTRPKFTQPDDCSRSLTSAPRHKESPGFPKPRGFLRAYSSLPSF